MYVWASGHLGFWASEHLGIWASGHPGVWASGYLSVHQSGTTLYRATPLDKLQEMLFQGSSNNLNRSSSKSKSNVLDNASMDSSRYEDDTF